MNKVKKQHYVARGYLKNFAVSGQINTHDKTSGAAFKTNIMNTAHENFFYELPVEDGLDLPAEAIGVVEDYLQQVDDQSAIVIDRLLSNLESSRVLSPLGVPSYRLSYDEMYYLSQYIVFQNIRTKEHREKLAQLDHSTRQSVLQKIADMKFPDEDLKVEVFPDISRETALHIQQIIDEKHTDGLIRICMAKAWFIGYNSTNETLWTSDNPLIMRSHDSGIMRGVGWGAFKVEIAKFH